MKKKEYDMHPIAKIMEDAIESLNTPRARATFIEEMYTGLAFERGGVIFDRAIELYKQESDIAQIREEWKFNQD